MAASREICKICFSPNSVGFTVPDDIWEAVISKEYNVNITCLRCFTRLADEKLIEWDKDIKFYPVSYFSLLK